MSPDHLRPTAAPLGLVAPTAGASPAPGYQLVSRLGQGGCGEVWKAHGPGGFSVAMKFVRLGDEAGAVELRSLEILKAIRHANLLGVFGAWQNGGMLILAMELGDCSLLDRLKQATAQGLPGIPPAELLEYMNDAARGIDYLNEPRHPLPDGGRGGIQHRDIKPANLLLVGGSVKVADFGLAKFLSRAIASNTGHLTPGYAAPECFRGQTSDRSDQYSLAASYCQLRGGKLPFRGDAAAVMMGHLHDEPDLEALPPEERAVAARALAKDPPQRYPSCRAFVQALAAVCKVDRASTLLTSPPAPPAAPSETARSPYYQDTRPSPVERTERAAGPPPAAPRRRWPLWLGVVGSVVLLGLLTAQVVWVILSNHPHQPEGPPAPKVDQGGSPPPAGSALEEGKAALERRDFARALACFDQAIQEAPTAEAYLYRGRTRRLRHELQPARQDLDHAVELRPNWVAALFERGEINRLLQRYDDAVRDYGEVIRLEPRNVAAYFERGEINRLQRRYSDAVADFNRALAISPRHVPALGRRGAAFQAQSMLKEALADLNRALDIAPNDVFCLGVRGNVHFDRQEWKAAVEDYSKVIRLEPKAYAYRLRAKAWEKLGEKARAAADYEAARKLEGGKGP
jgi:serine/threonine protein kinase/Tfp pilus assembly protein PilF